MHDLPSTALLAATEPLKGPAPQPRTPLDHLRWPVINAVVSVHAMLAGCILGAPLPVDLLLGVAPTVVIGLTILVTYATISVGRGWLTEPASATDPTEATPKSLPVVELAISQPFLKVLDHDDSAVLEIVEGDLAAPRD